MDGLFITRTPPPKKGRPDRVDRPFRGGRPPYQIATLFHPLRATCFPRKNKTFNGSREKRNEGISLTADATT